MVHVFFYKLKGFLWHFPGSLQGSTHCWQKNILSMILDINDICCCLYGQGWLWFHILSLLLEYWEGVLGNLDCECHFHYGRITEKHGMRGVFSIVEIIGVWKWLGIILQEWGKDCIIWEQVFGKGVVVWDWSLVIIPYLPLSMVGISGQRIFPPFIA